MKDPLEITKCDINFEVDTESTENQFEIKSELVEEIKFDTESAVRTPVDSDKKLKSRKRIRKAGDSQSREKDRERNRQYYAGLSDEKLEAKKKRIRERAKELRACESEEQGEARRQRLRNVRDSLTAERTEAIKEKNRERNRKCWAGFSEEKLEAKRKRIRERAKEVRACESDEKLEARRKRIRERMRAVRAGLNVENTEAKKEKNKERARNSRAGESDEQLEARRKRIRERAREVRATESAEQAETRKEKNKERARKFRAGQNDEQVEDGRKKMRVQLSENKVLSCDLCERKFCHTNNLRKHKKTHFEKYFCRMCPKTYGLKESLKEHIKLFHAEGYPDLKDEIGEFKCNLCSEAFSHTGEFNAHKTSHSKDTKILYTTDFKLKASKLVNEVGLSKAAAELNMETATINRWFCLIFKPLYCAYCSKSFVDKGSLNTHEESHTKDLFYCAYCSESFSHRSSLKIHEDTHTKDSHELEEDNKPKRIRIKKYPCNRCSKMFARPSHLESHLQNFNGCAYKSGLSLRELYLQKYTIEEDTCNDESKEMMMVVNEGLVEVKIEDLSAVHKSTKDSIQDVPETIKANNDRVEDIDINFGQEKDDFATKENLCLNNQEETKIVSNRNTDSLVSLNDIADMTDEDTFSQDMAELGNDGWEWECLDSDEYDSASDTEDECLLKSETFEDVTNDAFKPKIENSIEKNKDDHIMDGIKFEDIEEEKKPITIKIRKKEFQCDKCSKLFRKPCELKRHVESCEGDKAENNTKEMECINQVNGTFQCTLCSQAWDTVYKTLNHVRYCHPEVNPKYQCEICARPFFYQSKLKRHMKGHIGRDSIIKESICELCGKGFVDKHVLKAHMTRVHSSEEENEVVRTFVCSVCAKRFLRNADLEEHELTHGSKTIQCPKCPKSFKHRSGLRSHVRNMHTESGKPFMSEEKRAKYKAYMVKYNAKYNADKRAEKAQAEASIQDSC